MKPDHVLIVGGGLAGPALAIALARHSIRSTILERRPTMQDIGGIIMVAPNAMRVMDKVVGVGQQVRDNGFPFEHIHIATASGRRLTRCGGFTMKTDSVQAVGIGRPVLHKLLLDKCREYEGLIELRYGAEVEKIDEQADKVTAFIRGADKIEGDVLIGADGIGSPARTHILGLQSPAPAYSGSVSIGSILPRSSLTLPDDFVLPTFIYAREGTFLLFAMDPEASVLQWATTLKVPERQRREWHDYATSGEAVRDIKRQYATVDFEPIRTFVDALDIASIQLWAPYELPSLPTWHTDRVCIIGDAAHAVSPSMGQGAAQAFEDVGYLARLLCSEPAVSKGYRELFAQFERVRKPRMDLIREMTKRTEAGRGETKGAWNWWLKRNGIWAGLSLMGLGRGGYLKGGGITSYDVTAEALQSVS